ncbi:DUF3325 domain-containing protein [Acinetobacter sp. ANC 4178]|uniref:DUF3325 domain-containing protein n=1 Tax=Acinetobacter sp. ANC 4178 TaxID=2529839 RepID=UPI00103A91A1|nr:DUF3325 domain-containing protein [Acinetobacter sp. ANC 4178]TCB68821.1 DUF3325 domain-containing protein [Acinetobacter sp. ANC 4178]
MMFFLLIYSLCSLAFIALASSMSKHQKQIFGNQLNAKQTRYATIIGWLLLTFSLVICILSGKLSNMLSFWVGVLSFAALFVGVSLSYFEQKIKTFALALCIICLMSATMLWF